MDKGPAGWSGESPAPAKSPIFIQQHQQHWRLPARRELPERPGDLVPARSELQRRVQALDAKGRGFRPRRRRRRLEVPLHKVRSRVCRHQLWTGPQIRADQRRGLAKLPPRDELGRHERRCEGLRPLRLRPRVPRRGGDRGDRGAHKGRASAQATQQADPGRHGKDLCVHRRARLLLIRCRHPAHRGSPHLALRVQQGALMERWRRGRLLHQSTEDLQGLRLVSHARVVKLEHPLDDGG
mmetsp:Transcript_539/g.2058  ORF Transcript_539/g.2058 Transcript_539/m.2058 type:complete len:239 (+) Transcript_539:439-1155(+)